jgi:hypothetical protein
MKAESRKMNFEGRSYLFVKAEASGEGQVGHPVKYEILETDPNLVESITKKFEDGRSLSLHVVDGNVIEKSFTYSWAWDFEAIRREKDKGAKVKFKWWKKDGIEVDMTYYGSYLVGKMVTLTAAGRAKYPHYYPDDWHDELEKEIAFPIIDITKIELEDGYSAEETENQKMSDYVNEDIMEALAKESQM